MKQQLGKKELGFMRDMFLEFADQSNSAINHGQSAKQIKASMSIMISIARKIGLTVWQNESGQVDRIDINHEEDII